MNTQNINNSNNETKNGMSQVVIDLRPQVKHQDGHGREVLADVYFRINVQAYTANLYTYTKEAREESEKACEAYYSEVVELLKSEGWTLRKEKYGVGDCPQMVKGTQYLYCHPQDISGQVNPADIEALEAKIKALTSCKYYKTDNYGDIIVTTSESDEEQLYRDTYADGLASIWQEVITTKRSNLYKDKAEAEHCVRRRICIANRRADLNDIGTGSYNMRSPLLQFLMEEYDCLLKAGYIKEAEGQNGRTLCRWINKKEEKELAKDIREAEQAEKERNECERQERHCAHWSVYTLEPAPEIKATDVLQVGTMVRMPGVIGGLRVEEIDRKGDRVICVDGCNERHTYKGLDYFTTTAEEIRIPEWLRICQYFEMDEIFGHTRVLCTDIEPCCDALWPVLIRWEDGEDKGGIHLTSALDALNRKAYYYSEYQKLGHQEARPQEWLKKTTNEKRATYYRACVELERMAGDGLPLVIRADGADTEANPWNALEKRVKTARVFHLGDRVKMHYPYQCNEVTGVINRIRFDEGSLSLGGWCTHYDIRFDEEYQHPNNFGGKDTGVGNISPERIELVERAEFCPEPASEWLQPGEKVAHYLDYGDGTGDWLTGNVTGYELCDDGTVIVIYGEYRTPLKGMVKYQPEMDGKAA